MSIVREFDEVWTEYKIGQRIKLGYTNKVRHGLIVQKGEENSLFVIKHTGYGQIQNPLEVVDVVAWKVDSQGELPTISDQVILSPGVEVIVVGFWNLNFSDDDLSFPKVI